MGTNGYSTVSSTGAVDVDDANHKSQRVHKDKCSNNPLKITTAPVKRE
jgi:hypothetical protein